MRDIIRSRLDRRVRELIGEALNNGAAGKDPYTLSEEIIKEIDLSRV